MASFIITIKLPKDPDHDPHNKITAACPYSDECSDATGAHHSFLRTNFATANEARAFYVALGQHVTRIESVEA